MITLTTSWDDGDILDTKLAALLDVHGMKGTFYITQKYRPQRLSEDEIRALGTHHEIGAHTLTHPDLQKISADEQKHEIEGSKRWLESVINKKVEMFCYPFGRVGSESPAIVKNAGFIGARTTEQGRIDLQSLVSTSMIANPYLMPTTLHAYPFPLRKKDATHFYWRRLFQPLCERGPVMRKLGVPMSAFYSWQSLARAAFGVAYAESRKKDGVVFHLWGHSWELEKYDMWHELDSFLAYVKKYGDCQYRTNGDIIRGA